MPKAAIDLDGNLLASIDLLRACLAEELLKMRQMPKMVFFLGSLSEFTEG